MCAECRLFVQTAFYVQGPSYLYSPECVEGEFCELRLACLGMRGLCGKSIMGSGERGHPLHRSGRKEYASCPTRTR
jgi:hypothetical protein